MGAASVPLEEYVNKQIYYGIKTGYNAAFVIDGAKRAELIAKDPKSTEIIQPLALGDDVRKWRIEERDRWLIVTKIDVDISRYPAVYEHLQQWRPELEKRYDKGNHWWELRRCAYYPVFNMPKIVYPEIAKEPRFTFDREGKYVNNKAFIIPLEDLFLLGVLNSNYAWEYAKSKCSVLGDENKGGRLMLQWVNFKHLPIPKASLEEKIIITALVQKCLNSKGQSCDPWEAEIDKWITKLYGL